MPYIQLTLAIGAADPARFEDALLAAGASSITLEDAEDHPVLEPAPGTTPLWPSVRVKALFPGEASCDQILIALRLELQHPLPPAQFEVIEDRAWEREWLKDFRPMRFGSRLWICPGGQAPPHDPIRAASDESRITLVSLDPGLAFGTGTHPTTALCLQWLDEAELDSKRLIDFGCGSGVLAIAALKLGARTAIALDIDPQALHATRENAARNGVSEQIRVGGPENVENEQADILLANILAEPLRLLAPKFARMVVPCGRIVLSGILADQARDVAACYSPWFDIGPAKVLDEWARLDGVRRTT